MYCTIGIQYSPFLVASSIANGSGFLAHQVTGLPPGNDLTLPTAPSFNSWHQLTPEKWTRQNLIFSTVHCTVSSNYGSNKAHEYE